MWKKKDQEIREEPLQEEPLVNERKDTHFIRAAYADLFFQDQLSEIQLESHMQKMKIVIENRAYQQDYNNDNPSLFYLNCYDLGKELGVNGGHLEALIRLFILKEEAFAYAPIIINNPQRIGFCIYLNKESYDNQVKIKQDCCYTKQKLEAADAFIGSLVLPSLDIQGEENRTAAKRIINLVKCDYYRRFFKDHDEWSYCNLQTQLHRYPFLYQFMDQMVKQDVIHSWNIDSQNSFIAAKLKANDLIPEDPSIFKFKYWRDHAEFEREAQFRRENCVIVSEQALAASRLNPEEQDALRDLVAQLNHRIAQGPYQFVGVFKGEHKNYFGKILNFLKDQGAIFGFNWIGGDNFDIYVKLKDY